jgi:hypothetical protein
MLLLSTYKTPANFIDWPPEDYGASGRWWCARNRAAGANPFGALIPLQDFATLQMNFAWR